MQFPKFFAAAGAALRLALALVIVLLPVAATANVPTHSDAALEAAAPGQLTQAAFPKWSRAMKLSQTALTDGTAACASGADKDCMMGRWRQFVGKLAGQDRLSVLRQVNGFVNAVPYKDDAVNWGQADYWATPAEFLARGGDCEDYAITKFYTLKALGFSPEDMRIVILQETRRNIAHAVLVVKHNGQYHVLDNLHQFVVTWDKLPTYKPIYSVNETSYWLHVIQQFG